MRSSSLLDFCDKKRTYIPHNKQKSNSNFEQFVVKLVEVTSKEGLSMLGKEIYLKEVAGSLALLSKEVTILNAVNLYDINIVAEDFFPGLLNLVYGYKLKNANYLEKNAPAIDLFDKINKIAVQVTSDNSSKKINHTIEEFNKNESYKIYNRLVILILTIYDGIQYRWKICI